MNEDRLRELSPPRRLAPSGGAGRAMRDGRRRRHQARASAGVATVSLAAVAVGVMSRGSGTPGGQLVADPAQDATPSASASATASPLPVPLPTPSVSLPAVPSPGETPPPEPTASPEPEPTPDATPSPRPAQWVGHGRRHSDGGPVVARTGFHDLAWCETHAQGPGSRGPAGFCGALTATDTVTVGTEARYAYTMCRAATAGTATLTFRTRAEISVVAYPEGAGGGPLSWTWAGGFEFADEPHTLRFEPGDCYTWTVSWYGQDDAGWGVPAGRYELVAVSTADELAGEDAGDPGPPGVGWSEVRYE